MSEEPSAEELSKALYASCATQASHELFDQSDLLSLKVIPNDDIKLLLSIVQKLVSDGLFKIMNRDRQICWKLISQGDAAKYKQLTTEEAMIFSYIESAGREGIWARICRGRSNLHATVFNRCLKSLESKSLIKQFVSAKNSSRKMYILANLQPSEDVTGGPFFTDGKLDEEFVHQLGVWIENYIISKSWRHHSSRDADGKKSKSRKSLPMLPGYAGYPTVPEITRAMNDSKLTSGVVMKEAEIRHLVDILLWDGHIIEVMNGRGFKSVRTFLRDEDDLTRNGLTEAPCGDCPVFDLCEEGGPVNARSCAYFTDWLDS